jgi:hypothetical protein
MEIRTKHTIDRRLVGDLEMCSVYLIFDEETHDNQLIITDTHKEATVLQKCSNDPALCVLRMGKDREVNVIGKVYDFNIVDVQMVKD